MLNVICIALCLHYSTIENAQGCTYVTLIQVLLCGHRFIRLSFKLTVKCSLIAVYPIDKTKITIFYDFSKTKFFYEKFHTSVKYLNDLSFSLRLIKL